ncbi:MAG: DUF559 domain-containing protein [Dehalococcoidia bacterium]|nr:DUF559 domain-containing protein [Dehalococcoidia bacterium]MDP7161026.1 DUF559 domain-containing protein [Dehalococcoidia bacterium]MDP7212982.1 DUF559 domain-containing protein [Dehalococcoidia bacterium]MDP7514780.1 DUF559 domain-containing protein [Dehalococcoidia bacterium]
MADFCCERNHLIVELDGSQYMETVEADNERVSFFERRCYRVVRFWNDDVLENLGGILETILKYETSPSP